MANIGKRNRDLISSTVGTREFAQRVRARLLEEHEIGLSPTEARAIIDVAVEELKDLVFAGKAVKLHNIGIFYKKVVRRRNITSSFNEVKVYYQTDERTKVGFSSFATGEKTTAAAVEQKESTAA